MCGIIGYIGKDKAIEAVSEGLNRLQYRGYDSWGVAYLENSEIKLVKKTGSIESFNHFKFPEKVDIALAHSRWATHGGVTEQNAHPHCSCDKRFSLVHNGIIENYQKLKNKLLELGHEFVSQTDTEVVVHLIEEEAKKLDFKKAVIKSVKQLRGSFALIILDREVDNLIAVRKDSPLWIGVGEKEYFIASDVPAFLKYTKKVYPMSDFELAFIDLQVGVKFYNFRKDKKVGKKLTEVDLNIEAAEKQGYGHFMLKEIFEQPEVIKSTLLGRIKNGKIDLSELKISDKKVKDFNKIHFVACGTAWHACLVGKYVFEKLLRLPVEVDVSSEFRYRDPMVDDKSLVIVVSQSGETADSIAALKEAKKKGASVLSIVNVVGSTISNLSDYVLYTRAGSEISVASTKAFISQLIGVYLLGIYLAEKKTGKENTKLVSELKKTPELVKKTLEKEKQLLEFTKKFYCAHNFVYLGRNINFPIALEGALKLKEISYIHAEGFASGEMKHGPIALINEETPTVAIAPESDTFEKVISNIQEIKARNGSVIIIATEGVEISDLSENVFYIPKISELLSPLLTVIPLQLFAYYMALERGCEIDKPRNLAKSVTVE